jgi:PAS domain S-box-containing protein
MSEFICPSCGAQADSFNVKRTHKGELYRRLVELCPEAIAIHTQDKIVSINTAGARLLGAASPDQIIGRSITDFLHPDYRQAARERMHQLMEEGTGVVLIQEKLIRADGAVVNVEVTAMPFTYQGKPALQIVARDITERKLAEKVLRDKTDQLQAIIDAMTVFLDSGNWREASSLLLRCALSQTKSQQGLLGVKLEGPVLRVLAHEGILWNENQDFYRNAMRAYEEVGYVEFTNFENLLGEVIIAGKAVISNDPATDTRSGGLPPSHPHLCNFLGVPILKGAEVIGMIGVANRRGGYTSVEQTKIEVLARAASVLYDSYRRQQREAALEVERKRAEEALHVSEQRLRESLAFQQRLIASLPTISFITTDLNAIVTSFSPGAERIFGYKAEEMIGQPVAKLHLPEDVARFPEIIQAQIEGRIGFDGEMTLVRKNGERFPAHFITSPILDEDGKVIALLGVSQDISERKQLEEQLRQSQKMEAIGRLAGGVAHDFNNLLTVINCYSDILLMQLGQDSDLRSSAEQIKKAGERAASLTNQLLAFSRRQALQPKVLNLNTIVSDIYKMLRRLIGEDIALETSLDPNLWRVKADPGQIEQVIMNLAVNARDAMPQGGKLKIETTNVKLNHRKRSITPAGSYVLLSVSDTGCGMDDVTLSHIFEPFFTTKEQGRGTGLGLSTVYGVIKQSGGHIEVDSKPGKGTTFRIYLPRVEEHDELLSELKLAAQLNGSETVLLVEDEESVRKLASEVLRMNGYNVLEVASAYEAIATCKQHPGPIHLMVTDVVMPGLGGRTIANHIAWLRPETKVLYISGYPDDFATRHGVMVSNLNFLKKPFTPVSLLSKVREALDTK